ncbi:phage tail protein [Intestinibacillus massiliensis]|nr:phage tail protein [Intestinibacillus massiliensis]
MAISTYNTVLKSGATASALTKLCDIKSTPDLGGEPEMIETTTMSDKMQTYIEGIQSLDALTFTANYDKDTYKTVKERAGTDKFYSLEFSDGSKFTWQGTHNVYVNGGEVNAAVEMTITCTPATEIAFDDGTPSGS